MNSPSELKKEREKARKRFDDGEKKLGMLTHSSNLFTHTE